MNKQTFLDQLQLRLDNLPQHDIDEHLAFYAEMLDDRIEDGLSEEAAVAAVGNVGDIAAQIIADTPLGVLVKERIKSRRQTGAFRTVLLILGSPVWLSLLIAAFAVVVSVYVSLWAVVVSLWSVFGAIVGCAFGGLAGGTVLSFFNHLSGPALIACGLVCTGLSIFAFFGCKAATCGTAWLTKALLRGIKRLFVRKEVLA